MPAPIVLCLAAVAAAAASLDVGGAAAPAQARLKEGLEAARAGDATGASRLLEEASQLDPASSLPVLKLANVQYHLDGDAAAAEATYERALRIEPSHDAHFFLGRLRAAAGRHAEAAASFEAALQCDASSAACRAELLASYLAAGEPQEEAELGLLAACCRADAADVASHRKFASALQERGRLAEAAEALERLIAVAPADAAARFNLGLAMQKLGDDGAAAAHFLGAAGAAAAGGGAPAPTFESHFAAAGCLGRLGRTAEAEAAYRAAIGAARDEKQGHDAHFNLGNLLRRADAYGGGAGARSRAAEAAAAFEAAVRLVPTSADAYYQLRRLRGVPHTVTCPADQPLVEVRPRGLADSAFSGLAAAVQSHPWLMRPNRLSESFAGTRGFVVRFNRRGLDARVRSHPQLQGLLPFVDAAALPAANVFVLNVLVVRPAAAASTDAPPPAPPQEGGGAWWEDAQLAVKRHLDITGAICSASHSYVAHQVDVLYVAVPAGMRGGRLLVWPPEPPGRPASVPPPAEIVAPAANTWVSFRGDAKHGVERCDLPSGGSDAVRVSLVLEQYVCPEAVLPLSQTFEIVGVRP